MRDNLQEQENKKFFRDIRRNVKISFFVASLIPISLFVFNNVKLIHRSLELPVQLVLLLSLALVISVLGLFLLTKTTNSSIETIQSFHNRLNTLVDITKHFRETLYLDVLLENIVKSAMQLNSAETASLLLYDEEKKLRFKVLVGEMGQKIKDMAVKSGEGISGWVADNGRSVIVNDVTKDERFNPDFDRASGFKTKSIMSAPLIYNNEVIGVIEVLNKKNGFFNVEDEKLLHSFADQAAISIEHTTLFEKQKSDIIHMTEIFVSAQDSHSPEKRGHVRRVAKYANIIGKNMGLTDTGLKNLYYAGLLHDVGFLKIVVYDPGEESGLKREIYIKHPEFGYEMVKAINLWKESADIILYHHEKYDGTGYPAGKKGEEIPLGARILSVSEVFDVITSRASYREKLEYYLAMDEIDKNAGTQFDPEVVRVLKSVIKESDLDDE